MVYEVLAAVGKHKTVHKILEFCPLPDFEICRVLLVLLEAKLLVPFQLDPPPTQFPFGEESNRERRRLREK
jgi:hypothetical protein